jgi:NAD dependent epimerase/dehydratase family enzyme
MSWIHIADEVSLLLWALDNDEVSGTINATAPNPVTNKEFSVALGKALHRPSFMPLPKLAVAALRGSELAGMVAESARIMPRRALDMGFRFRYPELGPALEAALK